MSPRTKLFAYALIAVLTGVLALLDPRTAVIYGCFCVVFAIVLIDLAERPAPSVHDRVRANRARRATARRNIIRSI